MGSRGAPKIPGQLITKGDDAMTEVVTPSDKSITKG